jgi:hypothetical protein
MSERSLAHCICNSSVASLLTHMLATVWAGLQIGHTVKFQMEFKRLTVDGACSPVNLLPHYWKLRRDAELPIFILNFASLVISAVVSKRLIKVSFLLS